MPTTDNNHLLHTAIIENDESQAKKLIVGDANLSELNEDGWSPLHLCAQANNARIARWLINAGAKVNIRNSKNVAPLHSCAWTNSIQVATLLLSNGANPNLKDESGWTPLMLAAWNNHFQVISMLLKNGASINSRSKTGSTSLHFAAYNNAPLAIEALLDHKVAVNVTNNDGYTAYALALRKSNQDCAAMLRDITTVDKTKAAAKVTNSPITINTKDYLGSESGTPAKSTSEPVTASPEDTKGSSATRVPKLSILGRKGRNKSGKHVNKEVQTETTTSAVTDQPVNKDSFFLDSQEIDMPFLTELTKEQARLSSDGNTSAIIFPEQLVNLTLNGEKVRRKSEVVIANLLFSFDINYVYERKLCGTVAVGINYPAFTIFTRDDRVIIWEHVSGLGTAEKRKQFNQLKRWYKLNGFSEGKTFFTTQDTVEGGVDSPTILEAVEKIASQIEMSTNNDGEEPDADTNSSK